MSALNTKHANDECGDVAERRSGGEGRLADHHGPRRARSLRSVRSYRQYALSLTSTERIQWSLCPPLRRFAEQGAIADADADDADDDLNVRSI
jgi:hypothetical protein